MCYIGLMKVDGGIVFPYNGAGSSPLCAELSVVAAAGAAHIAVPRLVPAAAPLVVERRL